MPLRLLLASLAALAAVAGTLVAVDRLVDDPAATAGSVEDLRQRSEGEVTVRQDPGGAVRFVGTDPGTPLQLDDTADPAAALADDLGPLLVAPGTRLAPLAEEPRLDGGTAVRYQQLVGDVPVFGGQASVQLDAGGAVLSALSDLSEVAASVPTEPEVDGSRAVETAIVATRRETGVDAEHFSGSPPELHVYDPSVVGPPTPFGPRLAWQVEVTAEAAPVRQLVLVDALEGGVLLSFSRLAHALDREVCDVANVRTADETCTTPVRTEGSDPVPVPPGHADVNDAYDFTGHAHQYFADAFGRDSIDGAGMTVTSTVRYCEIDLSIACPYENAFWNGQQLTFGQGYATDDVVAHELTHGVTEHTADLFYWYQSGAINESMSDVFGELADLSVARGDQDDSPANRWLVGEDLPGGFLRDMEDPPVKGDPDSTTHAAYHAGPTDAGGVHHNSGVNNKAAVLMADGGSFGDQTVAGLGTTKVEAIYYEVLTAMLTSGSDFQDLHAALPQACLNLAGSGTAGIVTDDCTQVAAAVDAVGMGEVPPAAPASDPTVCPDDHVPTPVFFSDVEAPPHGPWSYQTETGVYRWGHQSESGFRYATSGTNALYGPNTGDSDNNGNAGFEAGLRSVLTPAVALPSGSTPVLHFRHAHGFEASGGNNWDGGVVEYSTTGTGGPWVDLGPSFTANGYNGAIVADQGNPLGGSPAFVDESKGYRSSRVDLSALAGQTVRLRFRVAEDGLVGDYGWFVDDVTVATCADPELTLTQSAEPATVVAGDDIEVHLEVENTGEVTLTDVQVDGDRAADCDTTIPELEPEASAPVDCTYTTVDPDDVGTWSNTPTATAAELSSAVAADPVEVEVQAPDPAASVELAASPGMVTVGEDIDVDVTVTNTGNVDLTGVTLAVPAAPECSGPVADLPAGGPPATVACTYTTVDPDDLGTWTGTAEVSADQLAGVATSEPLDVQVLAPDTPDMTVAHLAHQASVSIGQPVDLEVTVTNTGNVALTGVEVSADAPGCAGPIDDIPVGGHRTVECTHTPTEVGDWTSTASAVTSEILSAVSSPTVTVDVLDDVAPTATITSPEDGSLFNRGEAVLAEFTCADQHTPVTCSAAVDGTPVENGQPVDTTTPGDHLLVVTAEDGAGNPATVEHTYTVAERRPDGRVKQGRGGAVKGDGVYNRNGVKQNRVVRIRPRRSVTFFITAQNDGTHPEALTVRAGRSQPHYTVRYFSGGQDVSGQIGKGTYTTPVLEPGEFRTIRVVVKVGRRAPARTQIDRRVTITSTEDPTQQDRVRFIVKRR